ELGVALGPPVKGLKPVQSPVSTPLYAVWGSGAGDLWMAGAHQGPESNKQATLLQGRGRAQAGARPGGPGVLPNDGNNLQALWGYGPASLVAVGVYAHILVGGAQGVAFRNTTLGGFHNGVWGSGPGDIWVAGEPYPNTTDGYNLLHWGADQQ